MKFKKVKQLLSDKGFKLEYRDSCSLVEIDTLIFEKENVDGCIVVDFSRKSKIPKYIKDGEEFDYATAEWVEEFTVNSVSFQINISLSYMTEGVIDPYDSSSENIIYISGKDLKYFEYVLELVSNPYAIIDFNKVYNKQLNKFLVGIKRFLPILEKYNLPHRLIKNTGDSNCIYSSVDFEFYDSRKQYISFLFTPITWKKIIIVELIPHDEVRVVLPFNCSLSEFEEEIDKQMTEFQEVLELYKKSKNEDI